MTAHPVDQIEKDTEENSENWHILLIKLKRMLKNREKLTHPVDQIEKDAE